MASTNYSSGSLTDDILYILATLQRVQAGKMELSPEADKASKDLLNKLDKLLKRIPTGEAGLPEEYQAAAAESVASVPGAEAALAPGAAILQVIGQIISRLLQSIPKEVLDRLFE